jgi:hypothetical protein
MSKKITYKYACIKLFKLNELVTYFSLATSRVFFLTGEILNSMRVYALDKNSVKKTKIVLLGDGLHKKLNTYY